MHFAYTSVDLYGYCVTSYKGYKHHRSYGDLRDPVMRDYFGLITMMAYELIASGESRLLSLLCVKNKIEYKPRYFSISTDAIGQQFNYGACSGLKDYDLYPIVQSLRALFQKNYDEFQNVYMNFTNYLFGDWSLDSSREEIPGILQGIDAAILELRGKTDPHQIQELLLRHDQQAKQIKSQENLLAKQERQLTELKRQMETQRQQPETRKKPLAEQEGPPTGQSRSLEERELAPPAQKPEPIKSSQPISQTEESAPVDCLPFSERLKVLADNRQKADKIILQNIQNLQKNLQAELQEIAKIREGLEFETLKESISQVVAIHGLLWDILEGHSLNDVDAAKGYGNLIDCCDNLQKNIVQALAMLGVTYINDADIPYAPNIHRTQPGVRPTRNAMVTRILRPGFSYRSKTLEKAIVELQ